MMVYSIRKDVCCTVDSERATVGVLLQPCT